MKIFENETCRIEAQPKRNHILIHKKDLFGTVIEGCTVKIDTNPKKGSFGLVLWPCLDRRFRGKGTTCYRVNYMVEGTYDAKPYRDKRQFRFRANTDKQALKQARHLVAQEKRSHHRGIIVKMTSLVRIDQGAINIPEKAVTTWELKS